MYWRVYESRSIGVSRTGLDWVPGDLIHRIAMNMKSVFFLSNVYN